MDITKLQDEGDVIQQHSYTSTGKESVEGYRCPTCTKVFVNKDSYQRHLQAHKEKRFVCKECGRTFTYKHHLTKHLLIHTGESGKHLMCKVCNKKFFHFQHHNLSEHLKTHTQEKPFVCEICGRAFTQREHLRVHLWTHRSTKPFSCEVCQRSFSCKGTLLRHLRNHSDKKPFSCDQCSKSFTRRTILLQHVEQIHNKSRPYACHVCGARFTQKGNLKNHLQRRHSPPETQLDCEGETTADRKILPTAFEVSTPNSGQKRTKISVPKVKLKYNSGNIDQDIDAFQPVVINVPHPKKRPPKLVYTIVLPQVTPRTNVSKGKKQTHAAKINCNTHVPLQSDSFCKRKTPNQNVQSSLVNQTRSSSGGLLSAANIPSEREPHCLDVNDTSIVLETTKSSQIKIVSVHQTAKSTDRHSSDSTNKESSKQIVAEVDYLLPDDEKKCHNQATFGSYSENEPLSNVIKHPAHSVSKESDLHVHEKVATDSDVLYSERVSNSFRLIRDDAHLLGGDTVDSDSDTFDCPSADLPMDVHTSNFETTVEIERFLDGEMKYTAQDWNCLPCLNDTDVLLEHTQLPLLCDMFPSSLVQNENVSISKPLPSKQIVAQTSETAKNSPNCHLSVAKPTSEMVGRGSDEMEGVSMSACNLAGSSLPQSRTLSSALQDLEALRSKVKEFLSVILDSSLKQELGLGHSLVDDVLTVVLNRWKSGSVFSGNIKLHTLKTTAKYAISQVLHLCHDRS